MGNLGDSKAKCVGTNLQHHYPPLHAETIELRVGSVDTHEETYGRFMVAVDSADMIVDASAEVSVNRYLEALASAQGIPYVWAYGTNGAWGGVVGRSVPGGTAGCYECFRYRLLDGATLCRDAPEDSDSYTDFVWDVVVLSQWDDQTALPTVPEWRTYTMKRHRDCQHHR